MPYKSNPAVEAVHTMIISKYLDISSKSSHQEFQIKNASEIQVLQFWSSWQLSTQV
eukprot:m.149412 g.149412  ORF g.149412 m.149412 type:complete len:56 (+) comp38524_c0_seq11:1567-1734(+)